MTCNQILIIEDERDARESLSDLLELEGFQTAAAENGKEGLELLAQMGTPCLILLDLMMPVMNGWQFLQTISNEQGGVLSRTQVVVVSAAADVGLTPLGTGYRVMPKPIDIDALIALAREHCARGKQPIDQQSHD